MTKRKSITIIKCSFKLGYFLASFELGISSYLDGNFGFIKIESRWRDGGILTV